MSGHLLLFGQDITRPTPAIHHGNGHPYAEYQFPGGVITYRDVADIDEAIAAHAELRRMLADAQAGDVVVPPPDDCPQPDTDFDISDEEFEAAKAHVLARHGAMPPALQSVIDRGGRFGLPVRFSEDQPEVVPLAGDDLEPLPPLPQREPAGPPAHPWQAAMDAELSPEALAEEMPLAALAPEPQEDEAEGGTSQ